MPPNIQPWMVKSDDGNDVDNEESEFYEEMAEEYQKIAEDDQIDDDLDDDSDIGELINQYTTPH